MAIIPASDIPSISLLYKLRKLSPPQPSKTPLFPASKQLNSRLALIRADIVTLATDAIVNAANRRLLGGGGVDGAIHRAAGPGLYAECAGLRGCATGSAKMTRAYDLPCRRVIHAVGPVYDPLRAAECEALLAGCYTRSLELAAEAGCRSVAFSAISTGVYGYPSREAAAVALRTIRRFLEGREEGAKIDKVVIVAFEGKDVVAYEKLIPLYFPPVVDDETSATAGNTRDQEIEAELEAEAEAVAQELPDPPKSDPSDTGHAGKKQKHNDA
ncbi:hypothetical protein VTK26DRAFT_6716 [Humicola hyalothermophila]